MGEQKKKQTAKPKDYRKKIQSLRLMDDNFMSAVFAGNKKAVQLVLRIILEKPDLVVEEVRVQDEKHNLRGRSVRLDVHAVDTAGAHYDIEIQRSDSGADPKRARLNLSLWDSENVGKSMEYKQLPETFIVFITENDVLGHGFPLYHIERFIVETKECFEDGEHIIFANGTYRGDDDIGRLMADFNETDPSKMHYEELAEPVRYLKGTEKGVQTMCRIFEDVKNEGREEGREEGKAQLVKEMRKTMTEEQIASLVNLPLEQVVALLN